MEFFRSLLEVLVSLCVLRESIAFFAVKIFYGKANKNLPQQNSF